MKIRLNITAIEEEISSLKISTGIKTTQELINNSLALLSWAIKEKSLGNIICSINDDKNNPSYKEIVLPCFEKVSRY